MFLEFACLPARETDVLWGLVSVEELVRSSVHFYVLTAKAVAASSWLQTSNRNKHFNPVPV